MIILESNRLRAELAPPNFAPNNTLRFDRSGFVSEVVLDGNFRFCASEPNQSKDSSNNTGGRGICNEYKFDISDEIKVGEWFPKIGVGLLQKNANEPYDFFKKYELQPYDTIIEETTKTKAKIITSPTPCHGYATTQTKTIEVSENTLSISTTLTNTGEKPISAREYNHNFLTICGMALGSDYRIDFEDIDNLEDFPFTQGILEGSGRSIMLKPYAQISSFGIFPDEKLPKTDIFRWKLSNSRARASISVCDEIDLCELILWAADHMISVETFHKINIKPGESSSWKRTWTFEGEK